MAGIHSVCLSVGLTVCVCAASKNPQKRRAKVVMVRGGRLVRGWTCDREVAGSTPARGCCVPTPTQRAIPPGSVNE